MKKKKTNDGAGSLPANTATETPAAKESADLPAPVEWATMEIPLAQISPDPNQPRDHITDDSVREMAISLAANGLLQPVLLVDDGEDKAGARSYHLVAGERRWQGARQLGWATIAARVALNCTPAQARAASLIENLHREDLNAMQTARGYADLQALGWNQAQIAASIHRDRSTVANTLRLLDLPGSVQKMIVSGELSMKHGVALLRFKDWPKIVEVIALEAIEDNAPAEELRDGLPFSWALEREKLVREIHTTDREDAGVTWEEIEAQPWCLKVKQYSRQAYFATDPAAAVKWLTEKKTARETELAQKRTAAQMQHMERVKKAKAAGKPPPPKPKILQPEAATGGSSNGRSSGGGMTEAEKRARKKKIEENKANRAKVEASFLAATENLTKLDAMTIDLAVIVAEMAMSKLHYSFQDDATVRKAADKLGVSWQGWSKADKLKPHEVLKVVVMAAAMEGHHYGVQNAWGGLSGGYGGLKSDLQRFAKGWEKFLPKPDAPKDGAAKPAAKKKAAKK